MAKFGFDTKEVDVNATVSHDPIPEGEYTLKCLEAEEKTTSAGTGSYIKAKFEVATGEFAGRWVWQNYNINNPSEKAQSIGRQQLVSWATAAGKPDADDTDKLIGRKFNAVVVITPAQGPYAASNEIKSYVMADAPAPAAKAAAKPAPAKPSAGKAVNPWD